MRKYYLFSLIILIIMMISLLPLIDGYVFKKNYLKFLSSLKQSKGGVVDLGVANYHLGWFKSNAQLTVNNPLPFVMNNQIMHGPFVYDPINDHYTVALAAITGATYLPPDLQQKFQSGMNIPFLQSRGIVSFDNKLTQVVTVSPCNIPTIGTITVQDIVTDSVFTISNNKINKVNITGNSGGLSLIPNASNPNFPAITIAPVAANQELDLQQDAIWGVNGTVKIANVSLKWPDGKQVLINNIAVSILKGLNASNLYDNKIQIMIDSLHLPTQFPTVSALQLNLAITNLDPTGIKQFQAYQVSLQNGEAADINKMSALVSSMLTATSAIDFDLNMNTSLGVLVINSKAMLNTNASKSESLNDLMDNVVINTNIRVSAALLNSLIAYKLKEETAASPETVADTSQKMIDTWVAEGYLDKNNNDYVTTLNVENKTITINGKPLLPSLPLPGAMPGMLPGPVIPMQP